MCGRRLPRPARAESSPNRHLGCWRSERRTARRRCAERPLERWLLRRLGGSGVGAEKGAAYWKGGGYLLGRNLTTGQRMKKDPVLAFQNTLKAAEQGYVPAEAAAGMMYAIGKGVEQNYAEATKWWTAAAEAGHLLAATNGAVAYRGVPGVRAAAAESERLGKFVARRGGGNKRGRREWPDLK